MASNKENIKHLNRIEQYIRQIENVYSTCNTEAAKLATTLDYDQSEPFKWSDYPETNKKIAEIQSYYANSINAVVVNGIAAEWKEGINVSDEIADNFLVSAGVEKGSDFYESYFRNEYPAKTYIQRREKDYKLSNKIWNLRTDYKEGLEAAISLSLEKGTSAVQLSKQISQYLNDFKTMKQEYTELYGKADNIKDCEYRSARIARTEINMSYRSAELERYNDLDFVLGYEIKRSHRKYGCPVCESLKGKYPKDFVWTGWHPNCRCFMIPILQDEDDFFEDKKDFDYIQETPSNFNYWINENSDRIAEATKRGTLPYFIKDNKGFW